jgi:hypothetical protein
LHPLFIGDAVNELNNHAHLHRRMGNALFQVAFRGIVQRAQAAGSISEEELTRFWQALQQAEQEQHFFARVGGFVVSGRKPA